MRLSESLQIVAEIAPEKFEDLRRNIEPEWVLSALQATGTVSLRRRPLPAEQVVWLVIGMALFRERSIHDIVTKLDLAMPGSSPSVAPSTVAEARTRLRAEPLEWLFSVSADRWAHDSARRHAVHGLALYGADGTTLRVPDSAPNTQHFGYSHSVRGDSAYPLVHLLLLPALLLLSCGVEPGSYQPASCVDGTKNGDELDVDCGGSCVPCGEGKSCAAAADCASGVCQDGACRPGACGDGVRSSGELDVDCGGACPPCGDGKACDSGKSCASGVCRSSFCQAPRCDDGVKNGGEIDADCGGSCGRCAAGKAGTGPADCGSGVCQTSVCQAPRCNDTVKNGDEIDADCGGSCGRCALGKGCAQTADCAAGVCDGAKCRAPLSCLELLRAQPASTSGVYRIDPDGVGVGKADFAAYCDMTTDGGGWTLFNWVKTAFVSGQDPLGQTLDECDPSANLCRARIPTQVTPTALMVKELTNNQMAAWRFDSNNTISNGALGALRNKTTSCQNNTGVLWQPYLTTGSRSYCGNGGEGGCDSFYYLEGGCSAKPANGWGLELDGDTGCGAAAFKMGSTGTGCGASGSTPDDYGFMTNGEYKAVFGELYYR